MGKTLAMVIEIFYKTEINTRTKVHIIMYTDIGPVIYCYYKCVSTFLGTKNNHYG